MAILVDWDNTGVLPQSKASGAWTPIAFNAGRFRFTWTPTNASTHSTWRPASLTFWCLLGSSGDANGGGIWLEWNSSTSTHSIVVASLATGAVIARRVVTWTAGQGLPIDVDQSASTATLTVSGFGTASYTRENILTVSGAILYWGRWGGSPPYTLLASTTSDIDDGVSGYQGDLGITIAAPTLAGAGESSADGAGAAALDAVLAGAGAVDGLPVDGVGSATVGALLDGAGASAVAGDAAAQLDATLAAAGFVPGGLAVHSVTSSVAIFGQGAATLTAPGGTPTTGGGTIDPDGRAIVPWNPPTSGSTFYAVLGRPKTAVKSISDNRGNTYSLITVQNYQPDSSWETAVYEVRPAIGGTGTVVTIPGVVGNEATLMITAIEQANVRYQHVTGYSSPATTITSPTIQTSGPGLIVWTWFGDGPTLGGGAGNNGVELVVNASTPGAVVVDSRTRNNNNGWIQCKQWVVQVAAAGTYSLTVVQGRSEGARWYGAAYQTTEYVSGDLGVTLGAALAGDGAVEITAAGSVTLTAALDGVGSVTGVSGEGAAQLDAVLAGAGGASVSGAGVAQTLATAAAAGAPSVEGGGSAIADAALLGAGFAVDSGTIVAAGPTAALRPPRANYPTAPGAAMPSELVAGDLEPDLLIPLLEPHPTIAGARQPIDLTGAVSVALVWRVPGTTGPELVLPAVVQGDPALGQVAHTWAAGETSVAGLHLYRVRITWAGGEVQHVPSSGTYTLLVSSATI